MTSLTQGSVHGPFLMTSLSLESIHGPFLMTSLTQESIHGPFLMMSQALESIHGPFLMTSLTLESIHGPFLMTSLTQESIHGPFLMTSLSLESIHGPCIILGDMDVHFDSPNNPCPAKLLTSVLTCSIFLRLYMNQRIVILLSGLYSDQKIMCYVQTRRYCVMSRPEDTVLCSASVAQSIASDHFCVVCELCVAVPPDPAVYRESRNILAIDRAAFRDDLCMLVSPELCPSIDDFNGTLQFLPEKACTFASSPSSC